MSSEQNSIREEIVNYLSEFWKYISSSFHNHFHLIHQFRAPIGILALLTLSYLFIFHPYFLLLVIFIFLLSCFTVMFLFSDYFLKKTPGAQSETEKIATKPPPFRVINSNASRRADEKDEDTPNEFEKESYYSDSFVGNNSFYEQRKNGSFNASKVSYGRSMSLAEWSEVNSPGFTSRVVKRAEGHPSIFQMSPHRDLTLGQIPRSPPSPKYFQKLSLTSPLSRSKIAGKKFDASTGDVYVKIAPPAPPPPLPNPNSGGSNKSEIGGGGGLGGVHLVPNTRSRLWASSNNYESSPSTSPAILEALANRKRGRNHDVSFEALSPSSKGIVIEPELTTPTSNTSKRLKFLSPEEPLRTSSYGAEEHEMTSESILEQMNQTEKRFLPDETQQNVPNKRHKQTSPGRTSSINANSSSSSRKRKTSPPSTASISALNEEESGERKRDKAPRLCNCIECVRDAAGRRSAYSPPPPPQSPTSQTTSTTNNANTNRLNEERARKEEEEERKRKELLQKANSTLSRSFEMLEVPPITREKYFYDRKKKADRLRKILELSQSRLDVVDSPAAVEATPKKTLLPELNSPSSNTPINFAPIPIQTNLTSVTTTPISISSSIEAPVALINNSNNETKIPPIVSAPIQLITSQLPIIPISTSDKKPEVTEPTVLLSTPSNVETDTKPGIQLPTKMEPSPVKIEPKAQNAFQIPKLEFGTPVTTESSSSLKELPTFSFGGSSSSSTNTNPPAPTLPIFSFGNSNTNTFSNSILPTTTSPSSNLTQNPSSFTSLTGSGFGNFSNTTITSSTAATTTTTTTTSSIFGNSTPAFSFGNKESSSGPISIFGTSSNPSTTPSFNSSSAQQNDNKMSIFGNKTPITTSVSLLAPTSTFSLSNQGGNSSLLSTSANANPPPPFSFGGNATATTTTTATPTPIFSFGNNSAANILGSPISTQNPVPTPSFFGGGTTNTSSSGFGGLATQPTTTSSTFSFGSTAPPPAFSFGGKDNAGSTGSIFGASPPTTSSFSFGTPRKEDASSSSMFGNAATTGITPSFSFGNKEISSASPFGATSAPPTSPFNLGSTQLPSTPSQSTGFSFGNNLGTAPPSQFGFSGLNSGLQFGQTPQQGQGAFQFGSNIGTPQQSSPFDGGLNSNAPSMFTLGGSTPNSSRRKDLRGRRNR